MRVLNSRVTNASTYRNFTSSVNNVHLQLNKSMNKISSGEQYESAADSPVSYFAGKKMDNEYQDVLGKKSLLKDVQNRIYQQELGARDIQDIIGGVGGAKNQVQYARTATTVDYALESTRQDLLQKAQEIVNDLNIQYEDFYIYGGNDATTKPFSLSADGKTFTFTHKFPGEDTAVEFEMVSTKQADGTYKYELTPGKGTADELLQAMKEQGRIDIGFGSIKERDTLLDTFTGGMNLLTGITPDAALAATSGKYDEQALMDALSTGPLGLVTQSVLAIEDYQQVVADGGDVEEARGVLDHVLGQTIEDMTLSEERVSSMYSELGNKYRLLDNMDERLSARKISLETRYKETLGADPYTSIMEMYNNQYAYNAALQVGSKLMSSSLFDFVG